MSTIKITHQNNKLITDIQLKVFTNDLQDAIHNFAPDEYQPTDTKQFFPVHQKLIEQYFAQHLICQFNAQKIPLSNCTYELRNDVFLINFILETPRAWKKVNIKADYFMELFPSQSNIIHIENGNEKRFGKMTIQASSFNVNF
ncbi:MAG TPA: hypothetical protein ENK52_01605 [Saprospiraceae bacterium]|nr:hypothetical protein [Saprospiraceae bacterium]